LIGNIWLGPAGDSVERHLESGLLSLYRIRPLTVPGEMNLKAQIEINL
jgi:hypothetical protein